MKKITIYCNFINSPVKNDFPTADYVKGEVDYCLDWKNTILDKYFKQSHAKVDKLINTIAMDVLYPSKYRTKVKDKSLTSTIDLTKYKVDRPIDLTNLGKVIFLELPKKVTHLDLVINTNSTEIVNMARYGMFKDDKKKLKVEVITPYNDSDVNITYTITNNGKFIIGSENTPVEFIPGFFDATLNELLEIF